MKKWFLQTSPRTLALIFLHLFMLLGVGLVTFRFGYTGKKTFLFFIWNLFLAYIPFLITSLLYWKEKLKENAISFYSLFSLWLLFLPNAPYLLTDLKHLRPAPTFLFWYDLLIFIIFSLSGFLLGIISLFQMQNIMEKKIGKFYTWLGVIAICFANGFGVYVGRFLRWNSWDVFTHPYAIAAQIGKRILFPYEHLQTWCITLGFGLVFLLVYGMFAMSMNAQNYPTKNVD